MGYANLKAIHFFYNSKMIQAKSLQSWATTYKQLNFITSERHQLGEDYPRGQLQPISLAKQNMDAGNLATVVGKQTIERVMTKSPGGEAESGQESLDKKRARCQLFDRCPHQLAKCNIW